MMPTADNWFGAWNLEFLWSLELGIWSFGKEGKNKGEPVLEPNSPVLNSSLIFLGSLSGLL